MEINIYWYSFSIGRHFLIKFSTTRGHNEALLSKMKFEKNCSMNECSAFSIISLFWMGFWMEILTVWLHVCPICANYFEGRIENQLSFFQVMKINDRWLRYQLVAEAFQEKKPVSYLFICLAKTLIQNNCFFSLINLNINQRKEKYFTNLGEFHCQLLLYTDLIVNFHNC